MYNKIFDKIVFSNIPPSNTNVLWIYPIDSKHYDIRMYTIVQQDEYTSIKKWTSIGITDIAKTELSTDFWYVGFLENIPTFNLEEINNLPVQRYEEYNTTVEDVPIIDRLLVSYVFDDLDKKNVYFDTRQVDPEKDLNKYYTVVIPDYYKINSIIKENYYKEDKTYQKDVLAEGEYLISSTLNFKGKQYTLLTLKFYDELTPFQITTNVVRDLEIKDFIVQETGNSIDKTMSQKVITEYINELKDKVDSIPTEASITNELGYNTNQVISQKTVTQQLEKIAKDIINKVDSSLVYSKDEINTKLQIKQDKLPTYENNKILSVNGKGELEWITPSSEIPDVPKIPTKLSQLENDTNFVKEISIVTVVEDEWVHIPSTDRWEYMAYSNILFLNINPNERIIFDSPVSLSGIYILPNHKFNGNSTTYELILKTSDTEFGIGTLEEIRWAKEPIFNPNKTYAISIECNRTADGNTEYLAMYAEFDTLNMEE